MTKDEKQKLLEALELALSGSTSTREVRTYNAALAIVRADLERPEADDARDAARYRHMRNNATFRDCNGPGLYWYLPRFMEGGSAERLDAAIDAQLIVKP